MTQQRENLPLYGRRILLAVLTVLVGVVQNVFLSDLSAPVLPLIPLSVSIALFEKEMPGLAYGILAGAIMDAGSALPDGSCAFLFGLLGLAVGLSSHYVLRNTLAAALLCTAVFALCIYAPALFWFTRGFPLGARLRAAGGYLPGLGITVLILPLFYYPLRALRLRLPRLGARHTPVTLQPGTGKR